MTNITECPHCGNTQGFVFGTCSHCGFNYLNKSFTWIRVSTSDLTDDQMFLIDEHAWRTQKWPPDDDGRPQPEDDND